MQPTHQDTKISTSLLLKLQSYDREILSIIILTGVLIFAGAETYRDYSKNTIGSFSPPFAYAENEAVGENPSTQNQSQSTDVSDDDTITEKNLTEVPIETDSGFSQGTCPSSSGLINSMTLLSPINKRDSLKDYVPPNLVEIQKFIKTKGARRICLEETTAIHLRELTKAMKLDLEGKSIIVTSGYRSPQVQLYLYNNAIAKNGFRGTLRVAPPFHSEHHLNAVDITSQSDKSDKTFSETVEGKWMKNNAWKYGFVQSYPKGKEAITGYMAEDWHWKFVGKDNAKLIKDTGLTFHEIVTSKKTKIVTKDKKVIQAHIKLDDEVGG